MAEFKLDPSENVDALVDKLKEVFVATDPSSESTYHFGMDLAVAVGLMGIPIEQAAATLQRRYLGEVHRHFARIREVDLTFRPTDWNIVVPPYLFVEVAAIEEVEVVHSLLCPDWQVLVIRSPEWQDDQRVDQRGIFNPTSGRLRDEQEHFRD